jgi:hypothetical protein
MGEIGLAARRIPFACRLALVMGIAHDVGQDRVGDRMRELAGDLRVGGRLAVRLDLALQGDDTPLLQLALEASTVIALGRESEVLCLAVALMFRRRLGYRDAAPGLAPPQTNRRPWR